MKRIKSAKILFPYKTLDTLIVDRRKYQRKTRKIRSLYPFVPILGLAFVIGLSLLTGYFSFFFFWIILFSGAFWHLSTFRLHFKYLFELFAFAFVFFTIYMGVTTYSLIEDPNFDFFYANDSTKFWERSKDIYSFEEIKRRIRENITGLDGIGRYPVFYIITLIVSYFSSFIDSTNLYVQKLPIVFVGALSAPYIFIILRKYTDVYYAYIATLIFIIFSHVSTYSVEFLRDNYTYFFYVLGFYLVTIKPRDKGTMFKLILLLLFTFFTRPEHGAFFTFFILAYIYINKKSNKMLYLLGILSIPLILYLSASLISMSLDTYATYEDVRERVGEGTDSLATKFAGFPFGIKHFILAFLSQTVGVPFWRFLFYDGVDIASNAYKSHNLWRFMEAISGTLWMLVWGYILFAFKKYKIFLKILPKEIIVLSVIAFLLLLAATADINVRRIFCVYPILYTLAVMVRYQLPKNKRVKIIKNSLMVIGLLYLMYFLLKG